MFQERLRELFENYDPAIQEIITHVLQIEQEHISIRAPRVREPIDDVITRVAQETKGSRRRRS